MSFKDYPVETQLALYAESVIYRVEENGRLVLSSDKPRPDGYYVFKEDVVDENGNVGCYDCVGCVNCYDCVGCRNCKDCQRCVGCDNCTGCNCCKDCTNCVDSDNLEVCTVCLHCHCCKGCTFLDNGYNDAGIDGRKPRFSDVFRKVFADKF